MTVIAITRELGTRGLDVANGLGKRLGLNVVNDDLIEGDIARLTGLRGEVVHRYFDNTASLLERWRTDEQQLAQTTTEEVLGLAAKGDVVIRGWGAPYLLRDIPHVLCVRVCAPMPVREQVLVERGLAPDIDAARKAIGQQDAANDRVMRRLFGADGRDASVYSLVLNTARLGVERCIEQIAAVASAEDFQPSVQSQRALVDRLVTHRVRAALDKKFGSDQRFTQIHAEVVEGRVTLSGQSMFAEVNEAAAGLIRDIDGVVDVHSEISILPYYRRHAA